MENKQNTTQIVRSSSNLYDDGNIPETDLPKDTVPVEPLPESSRPRKDGPGGD